MSARRVKMLQAPRTWDTPDAKGFREFVKRHYHQMMDLALEMATPDQAALLGYDVLVAAFFDKLAAPLIYLYESWDVMAPEEKGKYTPELAKIHEESKALAEKVLPGVPVVTPEEAAKIPELDLGDLETLPWTSFKTKQAAKKGEAGWIWRSLENAKDLAMAIEAAEGQRLTLGDLEYKFSGPEKQFISRRPVGPEKGS